MLKSESRIYNELDERTIRILNKVEFFFGLCFLIIFIAVNEYKLSSIYWGLSFLLPLNIASRLSLKVRLQGKNSPISLEFTSIIFCAFATLFASFKSPDLRIAWLFNCLVLVRSQLILDKEVLKQASNLVISVIVGIITWKDYGNHFTGVGFFLAMAIFGFINSSLSNFYQDQSKLLHITRSFFNQSPDLIFIIANDGRLLDMNSIAEYKLGLNATETKGKQFVETIFKSQPDRDLSKLDLRLKSGKEVFLINEEFLLYDKNDSPVDIKFSTRSIKNSDGKIMVHIATAKDVTAQKAIEKELQEKRVQNEQTAKLAALGEMSGGIAHEINNPLTIIIGYAEKIANETKKEEMNKGKILKSAKKIEETSMRVTKIVKGLVKFARREEAVEDLTLVELNSIIDETLILCNEKFASMGIELRTDEVKNFYIPCLNVQVSEVLLNLLNNAKDAIKDNDEKWIKILSEESSGRVLIRVVDSGRGIAEEVANKIFEPFYTTKPVGEGTGIGMSISKNIIKNMNGYLYYELFEGHTSFVISFPKGLQPEHSVA